MVTVAKRPVPVRQESLRGRSVMGHDPKAGQSPDQVTEVGRTVPAARPARTIQRMDTDETGQLLRESRTGQHDGNHPDQPVPDQPPPHSQIASVPPLLERSVSK